MSRPRTPMRAAVIAALAVLATAAAHAEESLEQFLAAVQTAEQISVPLRGDGELDINGADGMQRHAVTMIVRPPNETYIELGSPNSKALLLPDKHEAAVLPPGTAKAASFALDAALAGSDFTREDLEPFSVARFKESRISDESPTEMIITMFPQDPKSQYSMVVMTVDRDKKMPVKTLYYKETLNNLVKMRRDGDYVLVGRKWMPTTISMESFKLRTQSTMRLRWTQDATFPPELFDPAFLSHPSGLRTPAAAPQG